MRRVLLTLCAAVLVTASRADAVTIRDLVELTKAGVSDQVLTALIDVDRTVFTLDAATIKQLKEGGVSDTVILAVIHSGRTPRIEPVQTAEPVRTVSAEPQNREPQVIVIDHRDDAPQQTAAPAPVAYPVAVPVYVTAPLAPYRGYGERLNDRNSVRAVVPTDQGLVKARVPVAPNCTPAQPVYWGFDGKLRPGSWPPPPTVLCR
jgi:hypothetical protein